MPGTKRKHSDDDGLSVDDFVGTAATTITTTNSDACAAVVRAFSGAESFSITSNVFERYKLVDSLNVQARSSDRMLSIIDHFRHGENYCLTIRGSHDVISKGWDTIKPNTKKKEPEGTEGEDSDTSKFSGLMNSKRIKVETPVQPPRLMPLFQTSERFSTLQKR